MIVFESDRINFVKVSKEFANDYLKMINDEDVSKYISLKERNLTLEDEIVWINNKLKNNAIVFTMIEKDTNEFIGDIEVIDIRDNVGEIAIAITPSKQNMGYGREAIKTMIKYMLEELKLDGVELSVYSHNLKGINCYKSIGFKEYKRDKNVGTFDNESIDDIYMKYEG